MILLTVTARVRIIVQYTRSAVVPFRLIAYANHQSYKPVEFATSSKLAAALRSVRPDFSEGELDMSGTGDETHIIFAADWTLTQEELSRVGLKTA